jgi:hypothetical protein
MPLICPTCQSQTSLFPKLSRRRTRCP